MTGSYDDTVKKWDEVARTDQQSSAIHPAADSGFEAYERSGFESALRVMQVFPPGPYRVLDYGCGNGRVARHLVGRYEEVVGYDTSEAMREAYSQNVLYSSVLGDLDYAVVDRVYSWCVFFHHNYADGRRMLVELAAMPGLEPGALLALHIPIYDVAREPGTWIDVGVWTPAQFRDACDAAGLEVVETHPSPGAFSHQSAGVNHDRLQILRKPR